MDYLVNEDNIGKTKSTQNLDQLADRLEKLKACKSRRDTLYPGPEGPVFYRQLYKVIYEGKRPRVPKWIFFMLNT